MKGLTPRILVVDDDVSILELMEMALCSEGYQVCTAPHGEAALESLALFDPDLILLDMRMPVMDGWEFSRRLREIPGPHPPVVVLTADRNAGGTAAGVKAEGFLAKPFDLAELFEVVSQALGRG